ncbi:F-box protein SKIP24 isoform X2 [Carex littledalei]|uniref:F-box protein SKIP24 isoform X2 n=1 Tax=Carex littledalei TaxID=544730 RepID=A0A833VC77_9POAL|nr:F-box protein SKIP24 isoform X2 [Carex littledalei]
MEYLPDDIWHRILQVGIQKKRLNHVDLCSLAVVNNRFDQLSQDPALWATLFSRDFSSIFRLSQSPSKAVYRHKHVVTRDFHRLRQKREFERRKREFESEKFRLKQEFQGEQVRIHARSRLINLARVELKLPDVIVGECPGINL